MNTKIQAVIPHYNSSEIAIALIDQLKKDDFDGIYLLDDASRPEHLERLKTAHPDIHYVIGDINKGAGGNRNRIVNEVQNGILYFVDADMELRSDGIADTLRQKFDKDIHQMIGGLILNSLDQPMGWNYGHEMHPVHDTQFGLLSELYASGGEAVKHRAWELLKQKGWDYPWLRGEKPNERAVDWVAEGSFALSVSDFALVSGYDETMRYHEGQDLAHRLRAIGVTVIASSAFTAKHLEVAVRAAREGDFMQGRHHFYKKHWGLEPEEVDKLYE